MDLRKYTKKAIRASKVVNYEYLYCSHSQSQYGQPTLSIAINEDEAGSSSPRYKLQLLLDPSGKILEIRRLAMSFGCGYLIKKFPSQIEERAERILLDIVCSGIIDEKCDLSMLRDIQMQ